MYRQQGTFLLSLGHPLGSLPLLLLLAFTKSDLGRKEGRKVEGRREEGNEKM
jgi:hypothetical protein